MAEGPETPSLLSSSDQSSSQDSISYQTKVPAYGGLKSPDGNIPAFPILYPAFVPGLFPPLQDKEHMNRGPGLYAVPVLPYGQPIIGFPFNTLVPFTYNIPTERFSPENRELLGEQGQAGQVQQPHEQQQQQEEGGPQEGQVVVRRFQIAFQIDVVLLLKLAAVIFLFHQDGSKQKLTLLVFFASLVYLYQTGALAPVVRWLSRGMQRAAVPPPQPLMAAVRAENIPADGVQANENAGIAEGQPGGENENRPVNEVEGGHGEVGNRLWGIAKEIKLIVFGFITSLLPGFHNID